MPTAYITAPTKDAGRIARLLVEDQLAACVNRIDCQSTYRWEDEIHDDDEVILLAKTTDEAYDALVQRVTEEHPYDVPCIERFEERAVPDTFATWRNQEVREHT